MSDRHEKFFYPITVVLEELPERWESQDNDSTQCWESLDYKSTQTRCSDIVKNYVLERIGFKPMEVLYLRACCEDHAPSALVFFDKDLSGFQHAIKLAKSFENSGRGKKNWYGRDEKSGNINGSIAMDEHYIHGGTISRHLREHCEIKTIADIVAEETRELFEDYVKFARKIEAQNVILQDITGEYNITNLYLPSIEILHEKYINDEVTKKQQNAKDQLQKTSENQSKIKQESDIQRKELESRILEMEKREAQIEMEREMLKEEKSKVMALHQMVEEIKEDLILKLDKLKVAENCIAQGRKESKLFICKKEQV